MRYNLVERDNHYHRLGVNSLVSTQVKMVFLLYVLSGIAMSKKIKILVACSDTLSCLALCGLISKEKDFVVDCKRFAGSKSQIPTYS
jgi:hypothetical protein